MNDEEFGALVARVSDLERRVVTIEGQEGAEGQAPALALQPSDEPTPAECPLDWLVELDTPGGVVVDEGVAREGPCNCVDLGGGSELCYHKGVIGPLDGPQKALYCLEKELRPPSPEQRTRIEAFKEAVTTCSSETAPLPKGEKLIPQVACLKRELSLRGVIP